MASIFDDILARGVRSGEVPARTQSSRDWFRDQAGSSRTNPNALGKDVSRLKTRATVGKMYMFFYDPKNKKTLPYYDRFPLIFKIDNVPGGFTGINLHYLPYKLRAKLMDALYDLSTNERYDERTKLELSYDVLRSASKYKYFKPTFKKYLNAHVRSRFIEVSSAEWDIALFLPVERFEGMSKQQVWKESRKKV